MAREGSNGFWRNAHEVISILLTVAAMGIAIGFIFWIFNQPQYAAGLVISIHPIDGRDRSLILVKPPGCESKAIIVKEPPVTAPVTGGWMLAKGQSRVVQLPVTGSVSERVSVLDAEEVRTLSIWPSSVMMLGEDWPYHLQDLLRRHRGAAALAGAAILILGLLFLRLASAVILGFIGAILSWHLAILGEWQGLISLPPGGMSAVLLLGFTFGGLIGFRKSIPGYLVQRLGIVLIMMEFSENISITFGWPVDLTRRVAIFGSLISPAVGLWLLGAYFLSLGLNTRGPAGHLVLGASGMVVHILNRGRWIPGLPRLPRLRLPGRFFHRKRPAAQSHEVPLGDLVK